MRASQIVELRFGERSGSGYLITSRHVLTAKHVIDPNATSGTVQALAPPDVDGLDLSRTRRPAPWPARLAWESQTRDLAIVQTDVETGLNIERFRVGLVPRDALVSLRCFGTGFPAAAGTTSHQIEAKLSWVLDDQRFNLDIGATALPKDWRDWAGLSGTIIFASGLPVGVVRTVKGDWNSLLTATPVQHMIEDEGFQTFWHNAGLGSPDKEVVSPVQQSVVSQVASLIYRLDRKHTSGQILTQLRDVSSPSPPQMIMIPGLDEDEHRHVIQQLSQDPALQRLIQRSAASDQVILDLPWPAEEKEIDTDLWFDQIIDRFCRRIRIDPPAPGTLPDLARVRERLDQASTAKAYWVLVRRAVAISGHGQLLRRLFDFWRSLPPGQPVVLLICLALDEPVAAPSPLLPFLPRRVLKPDPDLVPAIEQAVTKAQLTVVDELTLITGDHIGPWIDELRDTCRTAVSEKFDGLRITLLGRIGEGKRLRRVSADIGDLLPHI